MKRADIGGWNETYSDMFLLNLEKVRNRWHFYSNCLWLAFPVLYVLCSPDPTKPYLLRVRNAGSSSETSGPIQNVKVGSCKFPAFRILIHHPAERNSCVVCPDALRPIYCFGLSINFDGRVNRTCIVITAMDFKRQFLISFCYRKRIFWRKKVRGRASLSNSPLF